ncbi:MAG: cytochrome P450 [Sporichthyaceae bacterium]
MTQYDLLDLDAFLTGRAETMFDDLREHDPVHWNDEPGGSGFWSITRYSDIQTIAEDHGRFVNGHGTQIPDRKAEGVGLASVHNSDQPRHTDLRRVLASKIRPSVVAPLVEGIAADVDRLLDAVEPGAEFDLVKAVSVQLPILVFGRFLGVPEQDCPKLVEWTNAFSSLDPEYASPESADRARTELFDYFHDLQEQRRREPREDIVSVLVQAKIAGNPLTREDLDPYFLVLTVAGNETTRNLVSGGLELLSKHPEHWESLTEDLGRIPDAVEEMIRLISPVMHMRRTAVADCELHGRTIRAGDKVVLWFAAGNRDPRAFDRPHSFVPDRSPNEHLGFGWGIHSCMGLHLARLEMRVLLERLALRGQYVRTVGDPDRLASNWFRGIKHLPAVLEQRVPAAP